MRVVMQNQCIPNNWNKLLFVSMFCCCSQCPASSEEAPNEFQKKRPNIVWFLTEDLSTHYLSIYNDGRGAQTPNVEWMAENGILYRNAYSNAPVSSAARTTLITGCYAPRMGGSLHRSLKGMSMPEGLRMFPYYLREAGYFTCNAKKTDYNVKLDKEAWNVINGNLGSWRKRPDKSKPFFFMRSNMLTHESKLHFGMDEFNNKPTSCSPDSVYLSPVLQDSKLVRYTYATFYDRIGDSDRELGKLIGMLREDGELDNTIIFYFGDNGGSLPGTKGYINDIGIHVPLVVYIPDSLQKEMGLEDGMKVSDLVSFMDFAPTVLSLAGVEIPEQMDGKAFLGKECEGDEFIMGYGDRFDELYAFNRTIRKGRFLYKRNYQPYHSQSLFAFYRYEQLAFREWKDYYESGRLNDVQSGFFEPFGPEELYDIEADPFETNNLADSPEYSSVVKDLRSEMNGYMVKKADLGFIPENVIVEKLSEYPAEWGDRNRKRIREYIRIADMQLEECDAKAIKKIGKLLASDDEIEQWWAATTGAYFAEKCVTLKPEIYGLMSNASALVRMRMMVMLARMGEKFGKDDVVDVLKKSRSGAETLIMLNDLAYLLENRLVDAFELKKTDIANSCSGVDWRLKYINSFVGGGQRTNWNLIYSDNKQ